MNLGFEAALIFAMILANGLFALAEIAMVSARKPRLKRLSDQGKAGATSALKLADNPNQFLSAVQIGITLVGTLAGAFGGATIAKELAVSLAAVTWIHPHHEAIAFGLVVAVITYLSLILGELVPKQIALANPERMAMWSAPLMNLVSRAASPLVAFLTWSSNVILKLLPIPKTDNPAVTEEEIRQMIATGTQIGAFHRVEHEMVDNVFRLGDKRAVDLMTSRGKVSWLDLDRPDELLAAIQSQPFSRLPVGRRSLDKLAGYVEVRDLVGDASPEAIQRVLRKPVYVPETLPALQLSELFRSARSPVLFVVSEHGDVLGLITVTDLLEAIVGVLPAVQDGTEPRIVRREDGSISADGLLSVLDLRELLAIEEFEEGDFNTLGGFMMHKLGRIPAVADAFEAHGHRFEVLDMDGKRVDRVLISRQPDAT